MQIRTKFKDKKIFHKELLQTVNKLLDVYENIDVALTEKLYPVEKDQYHFISRILKTEFKNRTEHMFLSLLFKDIYKTEVLSAKSGQISFLFALHFIKNLLKSDIVLDNDLEVFKEWETAIELFKEKLQTISSVPTPDDLKEIISSICQDKILSDVCWHALEASGLEGKIFIENSKNESYIVEAKDGYSFNLKPYSFFLTNNLWQSKEVKTLVVDGFVESISEIDSLVNAAYETKQPMVIISHGFAEEVISTLYLNFQKKNLNIIPIRVRTDLNNINIINDISVVCGTEPISFLKGQLLTFVKWEDLPVVNKFVVTGDKTTIENAKTRGAVSNQIRSLMEKREDKHIIDDIQDLIDVRIKNLTANSIIINLPNMSSIKIDEHRVKLDNAFRQIKTVLNFGFINVTDLQNSLQNPTTSLERVLYTSIKETITKNKYPLLSTFLATSITGRTVLMLLSSAGRVEFDITE